MKWRLAAAVAGAVGAVAAAGLAIAQGTWVTVSVADVQMCRPIFAEVHRLEQEFLLDEIDVRCARGTSTYNSEVCSAARDLLQSTRQVDDVEWFMTGNDMCDNGSPYPCYGAAFFNTPRKGSEAQSIITAIRQYAAMQARIQPDMDFMSAAPVGDSCIAQVWVAKYDGVPVGGQGVAQGGKSNGPMAGSKIQRGGQSAAPAPEPAPAPTSGVSQAALDDCIDGVSTMQACSSMLTRLSPTDPSYTDLALALMVREMEAGRPVAAIGYGDMIAAQRRGPDAELVRCTVRVLAKWDLNAALDACNEAGVDDPGVLELRGQIHLLAGRWEEAWQDFNTAYEEGGAVQSLYLRGLASVGKGRLSEARKDIAQAEADAPGTTEAFEADGYSMAAVRPRKPLAPPEAFAPMNPPAVDPAVVQPPRATPPAPSAPRVGAVKFAPDAPRGQLAPLTSARAAECDQAMRAAQTESRTWKGTPEEKALRLGLIQRTLFDGRCAAHAQAPAMVADAERQIAISAASAASAYTSSSDASPDAIDCVEPMIPSDPRNTTGSPALRNSCAYPVTVAYCNVSPVKGSWADMFACGTTAALGLDVIPANSATPAVFGREVQHFACRAPAGPVLTYDKARGLDGFCK